MKKSTIELNPKKKFRIPASWVTTRKKAYEAHRMAQYDKMRNRVLTEQETAIMKRKAEIIALHEVTV